MATDATGTPTPLGIPKYNTSVDAPTGNGFNAAMDALDTLITAAKKLLIKSGGASVGTRSALNFIAGSGASLSVVDDPANDKVDVTVTATGTTSLKVDQGGTLESTRGEVNFINGSGITVTVADNPGASRADVTIASSAQELTGVIKAYGGTSAPAGYLLCDGSAVSRTTYSALFSVIGTAYGAGDGSTTFNVPDTRGRSLFGKGTNSDVSALGNNDGTAVGSRRARHSHSVSGGTTGTYITEDLTGTPMDNDAAAAHVSVGSGTFSNPVVGVTGTLDAPSYLVVNHIIKT